MKAVLRLDFSICFISLRFRINAHVVIHERISISQHMLQRTDLQFALVSRQITENTFLLSNTSLMLIKTDYLSNISVPSLLSFYFAEKQERLQDVGPLLLLRFSDTHWKFLLFVREPKRLFGQCKIHVRLMTKKIKTLGARTRRFEALKEFKLSLLFSSSSIPAAFFAAFLKNSAIT